MPSPDWSTLESGLGVTLLHLPRQLSHLTAVHVSQWRHERFGHDRYRQQTDHVTSWVHEARFADVDDIRGELSEEPANGQVTTDTVG
ncbi:hypothetical protein GQ600_11844 [Phytophthora cactorum]|nr:hypothetical protein GQ600_11844 [Phytophthora cactorum]